MKRTTTRRLSFHRRKSLRRKVGLQLGNKNKLELKRVVRAAMKRRQFKNAPFRKSTQKANTLTLAAAIETTVKAVRK
jgi:hypothetical protein